MIPSATPIIFAAAEIPTPTAALVTFILYSVAVVLLAVASQVVLQKRAFLQEYFLGSRNLGWIAFTLTFAATSASAGSFGGFPSLVYNHGWVLGFWIAGYMAVPLVSLGLLGKRLNRISKVTGAITMPELIGLRFPGFAVRSIATGMIVVLLSIYLVPQFKMAGVILQSLLHDFEFWQTASNALQRMTSDMPLFQADDPGYLLGLLVFSSMVIVYTSLGGFRAVVWTDVLQGIVMLFGVMGLLVLTLSQVGGLGKATEALTKMEPPRLGKAIFYVPTPESTSESPAETIRVPMDTWFETDEGRLFRTNATAYIDQEAKLVSGEGAGKEIATGMLMSPEIKTVEIQGNTEKDRIRNQLLRGQVPALPAGVEVELLDFEDYAYGAGKTGVYTTAPGPSFKSSAGFLPLSLAFSFFLFWSIGGSGQPSNMVRQMSFDRVRTLKRSMIFLTFYFGAIYFPLVIIFVCGRVLVPGLDQDPDRIMAALSLTVASAAEVPWLAGLLIAAPFAAAMSTVDSFMLMISSSLVRDVYQPAVGRDVSDRTVKILSYGCTFTVGTIVMLVAISPPKFLQTLVVFTSGGLSSSFLVPVFLGVYWPRFNTVGALFGMLSGFFTFLSMYGIGYLMYGKLQAFEPLNFDPMIIGVIGSGVGSMIGCLSTAPPARQTVQTFFGKTHKQA